MNCFSDFKTRWVLVIVQLLCIGIHEFRLEIHEFIISHDIKTLTIINIAQKQLNHIFFELQSIL
jgi:hypothetical protein